MGCELFEQLDLVEHLLCSGPRLPVAARIVVDRAAILDVIEQLRASLPSELARARRLVAERESLLAEARAEAEHLIHQAEQAAAERQRDQLLAEVAARVTQIEAHALGRAAEAQCRADQHAADVLRHLQAHLAVLAQAVDSARAEPRQPGAGGGRQRVR